MTPEEAFCRELGVLFARRAARRQVPVITGWSESRRRGYSAVFLLGKLILREWNDPELIRCEPGQAVVVGFNPAAEIPEDVVWDGDWEPPGDHVLRADEGVQQALAQSASRRVFRY
jgi:hypothetical protein